MVDAKTKFFAERNCAVETTSVADVTLMLPDSKFWLSSNEMLYPPRADLITVFVKEMLELLVIFVKTTQNPTYRCEMVELVIVTVLLSNEALTKMIPRQPESNALSGILDSKVTPENVTDDPICCA